MAMTVDWDDVARFVGSYMNAGQGAQTPSPSAHDSLIDEITDAYLAHRGLPSDLRIEVLTMVDSVL